MAAILIVEDDLTFATMLKTWLGKQGFQISTAGDLSKAHKLLGCPVRCTKFSSLS